MAVVVAGARAEHGALVLAGSVVDDAARPLGGAQVAVSLERQEGAGGDHARVPLLTPEPPRGCGGTGAAPANTSVPTASSASSIRTATSLPSVPVAHGDTALLTTDDSGRFCVRLGQPLSRYVARFEVMPSPLVDGASLALAVDLALPQVALRFDPEPSVVSLDDEVAIVDVVASFDDDGALTAAAGLPLLLQNEREAPLGSATTDATGRARFLVAAASVGDPGMGELRVRFAGRADAAPAERIARIERHTQVDLEAVDATEGRLPPGAPEDGIGVRLAVHARARAQRDAGAPLPTGSVELQVGAAAVPPPSPGGAEPIVAAAPLARGSARVVVAFAAEGAEVPMRIRYAPDAPWFRPSADLLVLQPLRPPSPWKRAPLLLAAAAAFAWVVVARLPAGALRRRAGWPWPRPGAPGQQRPRAREEAIEVIGPSGAGWRGRVCDAHDGSGVAQARVAIERRGFDGIEVTAQTRSADDGTFALDLPLLDVRPGADLVVEAPLHARLRRPLPPPGELAIRLVLRRRALLDRLVGWARRQGPPFDTQPEASPGHVRRTAQAVEAVEAEGRAGPVARWAEVLEQVVYGPQEVDERAEARVEALAPEREDRRP
ncbi:MAG: hypothetical protein JOZ69_04305 [Myxococcales bacterium]|nr:hypothetical protein [Myxococcales bacterium]